MSKKALKDGRKGGAPVLKRSGFLDNIKVFVPPKGIPFLSAKLQIWRQKVPEHGGSITQDPREPGITHILVGSGGTASLPPELRPPKPRRAQQHPQQQHPQQQQQKHQGQPQRPQHAAPSGSETTAPAAADGAAAGAGAVSSAAAVGGREASSVGAAPVDSSRLGNEQRAGQDAIMQEADAAVVSAAAATGAGGGGGTAGALFPSRQQPPPDREILPEAGAAAGGDVAARSAASGGAGRHSSSSTSTVPFTPEQLQEVMADVTSTLRPSAHTALPEAHSACNLAGLGAAPEEKAGTAQRGAGGLREGSAADGPMPMEIVPEEAAADATAAMREALPAKPDSAAAAEAAPQMASVGPAEAELPLPKAVGGARSRGNHNRDVEQLPPQQPAEAGQAGEVPAGRGQKRARQPAPAEAGSLGKHKPEGRPTPPASPQSTSSALRKLRPRPAYVAYTWLERCLLLRRVLPAADFPPAVPSSSAESGGSSGGTRSHSTLTRQAALWRRWMGEEQWHAGCADMPLDQLVLQGIFNKERSQRIGNEPLVAVLKELMKYEEALSGDYVQDAEHGGEPEFNHGSLNYARAAAMVRACSYRLTPPVSADQLPYVGDSTVKRINDILETGTTDVLEAFRSDLPVRDSRGALRRGTAGARTRSLFKSLPGVGVATAKQWWDLGLRSFADVEAAGEPGGALEGQLTVVNRFVLRHHQDLREDSRPGEWEEMQAAVMEALEAVSYPGWELHTVGGQARTRAVHDADMMVTHPTEPIDYALMRRLVARLVDGGKLVPPGEGFCMMTAEKTSHMNRRKTEHIWDLAENVKDKLQTHCMVYGCFKTSGGHLRRLDIIIVPPQELPYALIGWIGSRQFLRFMRNYCDKMPMGMNSHRLVREEQGQVVLVPDEAAPLNRQGKEWWPPGWGPGRVAQSQRDVFELVGLPYREPWERDCP